VSGKTRPDDEDEDEEDEEDEEEEEDGRAVGLSGYLARMGAVGLSGYLAMRERRWYCRGILR